MLKPYLIPAMFGIIHVIYIVIALFFGKDEKDFEKEETDEKGEHLVEHIVCFRNESKFVKNKLDNCYSLDYRYMHNTFIDDNSTDNTLELLHSYNKTGNTQIITNEINLGKNQSQIKAVAASKSEFLLFTDANVFLEKDAVRKIIRAFDEKTGGVCGNVKVTTDMRHQNISGKYWEIEKIIKRYQSLFGTVIGFDGGFYCVKRKDFNLKSVNELSDLETTFLIFEKQKGTQYSKDAIAIELEKRNIKDSIKARVRASNRVFWSYFRIFKYIKKLHLSVIIHFTLHKLIRYLFVISFVLSLPFFIIDIVSISPWLLLFFLIPQILRFVIESIAVCLGGIIALTGKEYRVWSQKKA